MSEKKIRTSVMFDKEVSEWLHSQAQKENRSISNLVNAIVSWAKTAKAKKKTE